MTKFHTLKKGNEHTYNDTTRMSNSLKTIHPAWFQSKLFTTTRPNWTGVEVGGIADFILIEMSTYFENTL